jgi:hypothetical protein
MVYFFETGVYSGVATSAEQACFQMTDAINQALNTSEGGIDTFFVTHTVVVEGVDTWPDLPGSCVVDQVVYNNGTEELTVTGSVYSASVIETDIGGGGVTLQSLATLIEALTASQTSTQAQLTAYVSGSQVIPPNPEILGASSVVFGAALVAGVVIVGLKRIYRLFVSPSDE